MATKNAFTPAELLAAVHGALDDESLGVAYEKARLALMERERVAVDLLRDGLVDSKSEALRAAGYGARTARNPGLVFGRLRVGLVLELGARLEVAGHEVTTESYRDDLVELAHADPGDAYDDEGKLLPLRKWPPALRRMVRTLKLNALGQPESVTFEGRGQVMTLLGKHKLVAAFDQARTETRTYIIRDYTGQSQTPALPASAEPVTIDGELVDQVEPDQAVPSKPNSSRLAPEDVDRGFIPVPD